MTVEELKEELGYYEDDQISRQAAIIALSHNKVGDDDADVVIQHDIETLKGLPSAQPEPRKGHWERKWEDWRHQMSWFECSVCHAGYMDDYDYCPNCGAEMEGVRE